MSKKVTCLAGTALLCCAMTAFASSVSSELFASDGTALGQVIFEDSKYGLLIKPMLSRLPMGFHGFHIHEHPNCGDRGMKAGGHLDPTKTKTHLGPYGEGHLGDLPVLVVDHLGDAKTPLLAPRLTTQAIRGRAIMIHAGGDTYTDIPPLGGGGLRIGCGKISE